MNCPSCGAPMRTDNGVFKCDYCHNVVVPEHDDEGVAVLGPDDGEACPVCAIPLMQATIANVALLFCTKCDGMLVSMLRFEDLIAAARAHSRGAVHIPPANPSDLRRNIACPHCHRPMDAHFYGGPGNVAIDTCEACSLNWLDHGELARIARAPSDRSESSDDHDRYKASDYDITSDPGYDSNSASY